MAETKQFHIGCQSWQYEDWVTQPASDPVFYPRGTRPPDMLALYAEIFDTIEVDSTAYGTPPVSTIDGWVDATPDNFLLSLKVPSAITHELALGPATYPMMGEFVETARRLEAKLGVILIQFAASFESTKENAAALRSFIDRLPADIRFAVEFRHPGWFVDWTFEELNTRGMALALVAGKWVPEDVMFAAFHRVETRFSYIRIMGIRDLPKFDRIYRERTEEIERWALQISQLESDDIFVYVDNYFEGHAPATANRMKRALGMSIADPAQLEQQGSLF